MSQQANTSALPSITLPRRASLALLALAGSLLLLAVIGAPGAAASCQRPTLGTSKHTVATGEEFRVDGTACGSSAKILALQGGEWALVGQVQVGRAGHYAAVLHLDSTARSIALKAVSSRRVSEAVRLRVRATSSRTRKKHKTTTEEPAPAPEPTPTPTTEEPAPAPEPTPTTEEPAPAPEPTPTPTTEEPAPAPEPTPTTEEPAPAPAPEPTCPFTSTSTVGLLGMTTSGCHLVASDTAAESSPLSFWSSIQCASTTRYSYLTSGGDTNPTAMGTSQGNSAYRKTTVIDGDEWSGERCELGENDHRTGHTVFYHEGEHLVTYYSERLPSNFPLGVNHWQTVMQMKQTQPADGGGGGPIIEMEARGGKWVVDDNWVELWSFPAKGNTWTRFAWDVFYSQNPNKGWIQVSVDLNGDGDFEDPGERSPTFHVATLKTEIEGPNGTSDGLAPGEPIPSHLRMGIYHDPTISCPAPAGCSVELDNVQVVKP